MNSTLRSLARVLKRTCNYNNLRCHGESKIVSDKTDVNSSNWKQELEDTMQILGNFVTIEEEQSLMEEIDPYMKRLRYERSHWDDAIHSYRETERSKWNERNTEIINRIRENAFPIGTSQIPLIHVLDLAPEGWIKPHVDSVRFCGQIIAGLSLLTDSVMRLTMVNNETQYKDFLLPRRSLYIMSGTARYDYRHEILKNEESYFDGRHVPKDRRVSVICRSQPSPNNDQ
ncbi:alpha-ketoglutarate-dependent dioxygenase alkB homolog 7, mitochondrial isoform X1 [Ceratina calcarata]|uniref:Alpha-ketoglutarate-dependent dioxygenase alkB homolog 7, mitochondrial isoform X1 n=1 Tax=Ceratina calcarata TaxID=156304 RepID=A0AAJ7S3E4_9HYME|nr:alpha-ketoglutarate-dependent dioxygenase alkB homolog 7, mitochondrial isoform X1 [Ceratina calcarata]XP_026670025.1 alpha-ketoglutarate-dependent dioxygenase alkB homolog 7, mitochondrial isoform X1 [Ceratina calcarata]XP_026670026.1 alpha-ketoglutarate-dependent dioxygenase alkB homolog 7, mitochondrial isoform X1 [Ceratina calcarata]XP_026670027.1 alpha-ketoglutarate-dependent dioxygenase alkB homolog 7, mitochondrial isoform X1 [Ceratina calcarata]XP_026670028.1 alpha-ketoglutarate-depe